MAQQIRDIRFNHLQRLDISRNQIESIEGLNRIWMPHLQKIDIGKNSITRVRVIRKLNCPLLNILNFCTSPPTQSTTL